MTPSRLALIRAVHAVGRPGVVVVSGGGSGFISELLQVPGASRTLLDARIPYSTTAFREFLDFEPQQYCAASTVLQAAKRAEQHARRLAPSEPHPWGLAASAALATDRPKKGDHRIFLGWVSGINRRVRTLTFRKDARSRAEEEALATTLLLNFLAEMLGLPQREPLDLFDEECIQEICEARNDPIYLVARGAVGCCVIEPDGRRRIDSPVPRLLLPGSFNPLHIGHIRLAETASSRTGLPMAFELSITNVDKPPLDEGEVERRLRQFAWLAPLWLTHAPTFVEKAGLFPGAIFVVGADTAARIGELKYYENDSARRDAALERLRASGVRFLIAGRVDATGKFIAAEAVTPAPESADLFLTMDEKEFRCDISSTELRKQHQE